ncbi:MAG: molybdopterin-dependent oxidoreductase [Rhizobiaceae bacterium]|nr:molybdopterin-dependent oxidoreductase [Rhizobiaceae bacterium]
MEAVAGTGGVRTTCPYCGVGCGVVATPAPDGSVIIEGDAEHPANFGRLCSKGSALGTTLSTDERLLFPTVSGRRATWDEALDLVANRFAAAIASHGPDSVAFYVSGQLLTEDYYVANKLMKGFIGSGNIDTNSRLCMSSSVAGHRRAFGSDTVPGTYEDLELADLVVLVGSNLAWCHPVIYQRIAAAKALRPSMKVVLVDPRRTMTADIADLHLAIAPDGDVALFAGLLAHLDRVGAADAAYIDAHTRDYEEALKATSAASGEEIATASGLDAADIAVFYSLFAATEKVVTVYSQGVNQSVTGTDKVNAIINCHLATGRIGRPGMGPFSVTGQPNAMGGREVGGMANMLAAHMAIEEPADRALVQRFWQSPTIAERPGLKAVDLFRAVSERRIQALWIMGTNPVDSLPDADAVREGLAACPFVVVSDVVSNTDTLPFADVALPAAAWGEKDGTVTNSERRISRQRPFMPAAGEAKPDWWIIAEVAKRMGFADAFAFSGPADVFDEHARLSAEGNDGARDFDIGGLAGQSVEGYERMAPVQWPARARSSSPEEATIGQSLDTRFFGAGGFFHPDGKARFIPLAVPKPVKAPAAYPFVLNTGRVRDHWHTMTRTGLSARLSAHMAEPFAELHPDDAAGLGIAEADIVRVASEHGEVLVRCLVTDRQRRGSVFVPMHWTDQFAGKGRVDAAVSPAVDPFSGQPGLKQTHARVSRYDAAWHGFAVTRERPAALAPDYFALARTLGGWRIELADREADCDWTGLARHVLGCGPERDLIAYRDDGAGLHRFACFDGERLAGALWIARGPVAVSRLWAASQLAGERHEPRDRVRLLAGRGGADRPDPGAIVCSCFSVGVNDIARAVLDTNCLSVEAVGAALKAGTNCGSCRSEIKGIIDGARIRHTA